MIEPYENDIVVWANEQAALIRAGRFDQLDLEHVADEIEDVGKAEQREFASRISALLILLVKWKYQPAFRCDHWQKTINHQRRSVAMALGRTPSLTQLLSNTDWILTVWADAIDQVTKETGLDSFSENCPWKLSDVIMKDWLPT